MPTAYLSPSQLQDLTNVSSTAPVSGDNGKALVWNQTAGKWQAEQVAYSSLSGTPTIPTVNNGQLSLGVSGNGLTGSQTFTANQSGNATFTVASNATANNTANTIVFRDNNSNFAANEITAKSLRAEVFSQGLITKQIRDYGVFASGSSVDLFATIDRFYRADKIYTVSSTNFQNTSFMFDLNGDNIATPVVQGSSSSSPAISTVEIDFTSGLYPGDPLYGLTYANGTIAITPYPLSSSINGFYKIEILAIVSYDPIVHDWIVEVENQSFYYEQSSGKTTLFHKISGAVGVKKVKITFTTWGPLGIALLRYFPDRPNSYELKSPQIDPVGLTQQLVDTTPSTSTTTGALRIAGGAGIAGALHVGGQINGLGAVQSGTPASATATGTAGQVRWDTDYIYVCTATNTWKRVAISTWP
jgi:hypothetical protein